ncbi:hypothetical protein PI95_024915 [Hassallia byssoidea VB512170]|uniref:Uncharacterized protein n=1 Tax=Hassallia byssoidea VB512170 TaxID=1304833 RepID=A0A846HH24_9CYAN|nr:hypothetical protein [Hassalia byssoidea]NEU75711.1 hypothetical protein [Hassalia byssoidea VB512170]
MWKFPNDQCQLASRRHLPTDGYHALCPGMDHQMPAAVQRRMPLGSVYQLLHKRLAGQKSPVNQFRPDKSGLLD